ncbi:hypothetical protein D3C85_1693930 [compost metagenome]
MNEMTAELKPSRYHYISSIIKDCFSAEYDKLREAGQLSYKAVLLVETCKEIFDVHNFCEQHMDDPEIKQQIINQVGHFFKQNTQN